MPLKNINITRPMGKAAMRSVEAQQLMANALKKNSMNPLTNTQAGRVVVPPSWTQGLAKVLQAGTGAYGQYSAGERAQEIDDDRSQDRIDRVQAYQKDMQNTPFVQGSPEIHAVPPQGISPNPYSSRAPLDSYPRLSYGKMDDHNPYVPASEYVPAVPDQQAAKGLSRQDSAIKNFLPSDNPEMQKLALEMATGTNRNNQTANMMDWDQWNRMTTEEQNSYRRMKSNMPVRDAGNRLLYLNSDGSIGEQYQKAPPPQDMPAFKKEQTLATEGAKAEVTREKEYKEKQLLIGNIFRQITQAEKVLNRRNVTDSGAGQIIDSGMGFFGMSTDATKDNAELATISGWMVSNVPRMEGPQSDFDVENYRTMAAKVGDSGVAIDDRLAALTALKQLQKDYATGYFNRKTGATSPLANANTNAGNQPSPANKDSASNDVTERMKKYIKGNR